MPSIFARSRTASTPAKSKSHPHNANGNGTPTPPPKDYHPPDEFGRVTSRGSTHTKKEKDKDKEKERKRMRTQSSPNDPPDTQSLPDGTFLPFSWPSPESADDQPREKAQGYGYLSYHCEVVLGIEEVTRLLEVVAHELSDRGLTTPLLFSNLALDISPTRIKRLIDAFLLTCPSNPHPSSKSAEAKWRDEARFAGPHELGMTLRWGLARIVRIFHGEETRGIIEWEAYLRWREDEAAARFPPTSFTSFLPPLPPPIQHLLTALLALLSRLTAHATTSGLTPPLVSTLFGPLLFGLGSPTLPFHHTYGAYLRSSHAAEHLLLAFIRAQPALPSRLKDWVRGYPAMVAGTEGMDKARKGSRMVRVTTVRRNVRLYSGDLVRSAGAWASGGENEVARAREWTRVMGPPGAKLSPRYSDVYRRRMGLPVGAQPDVGFSESSGSGSGSVAGAGLGADEFGAGLGLAREDEKRFRSLTDLKWGEFEEGGFGGGDEKRLEFDLNEGARNARNEKRTTLSWTDFSSTGFTRTDAPLSATLQFSAPLSSSISAWPARQTALQHKLKKTAKALPPFAWDTGPRVRGEEAVEEGFVDVFCDLVYGSGWVERGERTFRECNWALVEYKSMPQSRPPGPPPPDPRTAVSLWLYEEFVPPEYRAQLAAPRRKIPLPISMPFSFAGVGASAKKGKPAAGGVGVGAGPGVGFGGGGAGFGGLRVPNPRELEFEGLLRGGDVTKVISLGGGERERVGSGPLSPSSTIRTATTIATGMGTTTPTRRSRFLPGGTMRKRSPAEYDALDFETRTMFANLSDEEVGSEDGAGGRRSKSSPGHGRRQSKDDAWVDILVGAQRRMNDQAAEMRGPSAGVVPGVRTRPALGKRRSLTDPEHAREEIAKALMDAGPVPPDDEDDGDESHGYSYSQSHEDVEPTDEDLYGPPEDGASNGVGASGRDSMDSADFEPIPHLRAASQDDDVDANANARLTHSRSESGLLPPSLQLNVPHAQGQHTPPAQGSGTTHAQIRLSPAPSAATTADLPKVPSKGVSSLIEMYREREKESLQQSRLPVRTTSLNKPQSPVPPTASPQPDAQVRAASPGSVSVEGSDEDPFVGRVSPGAPRYVHGAPLHNVVEAPEEEDDM